MDIYNLIKIYQITKSCYGRTRHLFNEYDDLGDQDLEDLCTFFLSLRNTMDYLEEILNEKGPNEEKISDLDVLGKIYALLNINTTYEELICQKISLYVH